jgi:nitrite reductase/ring-hydroxylating ferredoxin subunit
VSRVLCRSAEIAEGAAKGIAPAQPGEPGLVLVRSGGRLHGYMNSCPHLGTPLNFLPDRFLDAEARHLVCATHGAAFRIADGLCIRGPCRGESLAEAKVAEHGGEVMLLPRRRASPEERPA